MTHTAISAASETNPRNEYQMEFLFRQGIDQAGIGARMLSAAEILFAEKGQDKASLRELTSLAGVNLAAVNYHFGSKDALAEAVFDRLSARVGKRPTEALAKRVAIARKAGRPERFQPRPCRPRTTSAID